MLPRVVTVGISGSTELVVDVLDDPEFEVDETLTLVDRGGYEPGVPAVATVILASDDPDPDEDPPATLPVTAGLAAWLDVSDPNTLTTSGGRVARWSDLSGGGSDALPDGGSGPALSGSSFPWGQGTALSFTLVPGEPGVVSVGVAPGAAVDLAGNPSLGSNVLAVTFLDTGAGLPVTDGLFTWLGSADTNTLSLGGELSPVGRTNRVPETMRCRHLAAVVRRWLRAPSLGGVVTFSALPRPKGSSCRHGRSRRLIPRSWSGVMPARRGAVF